ncbi:MAG TPA: phytanoyl-CoA dioxygenase family protein [Chitinophagales bacterium]|nr:phytanoyl-CoA dioxygenase family protein [Chitinophagales bacterium]
MKILKSPKFQDAATELEFLNAGFVHLRNFLRRDELRQLKSIFDSCYNYSGEEQGMWNSLYNLSATQSAAVSRQILEVLKSKLQATFQNYKTPVASFMVKNPNRNGITDLHRDYSTQDESVFQYRNIWIPLVDTRPENGALYALKYSHTFFDYPLPMFCKWPYIRYQETLFKHCDVIDARAGDLVVYADRALHGSFVNQTSEPRPVVHFGLLHPDAELCYYYLDETANEVTIYDAPFTFFFENNFGNQDGRLPVRRKFAYTPPEFSKEEILKGLKIA